MVGGSGLDILGKRGRRILRTLLSIAIDIASVQSIAPLCSNAFGPFRLVGVCIISRERVCITSLL